MRLIDADDTKKNILDQVELAKSLIPIPEFIELTESLSEDWCKQIDMMPTVDAVRVVRCKDCVFCRKYNDKYYLPRKDTLLCINDGTEVSEDDFCSYGERREDD